ncbi:prepilin peptidase [Novosphingopyxis sp. YJ-S2-01]|uniref:prepilin peptidase n=1 Tax=Novosphingopyxis sp. YJ-S2-01 TaxID=2794021 RepID=UPI0018DCAEDF|nr:A24 family peptidase [Novosphingopyxis sp. YJ-S2-01]MBH9538218.1 prepilin peptidase [Novosphingopyxis sp. YJ-S2-01]
MFGVLGAIFGSFLATLCLRWPQGRSVLTGRSACDHCGRVLGAADLVPLLSALIARERCRSCGTPIDTTHMQIEFAALLAGAGAFLLLPPEAAAAWAVMTWLLIPLIWLDHRYLWLPNPLVLLLAAAGASLGGFLSDLGLADRIIGGVAGWAVLATIAALYRHARGQEGLGQGDPKLLGALGLWLGWQALPFLLLLASGFGLGLALLRARTQPLAQQKIPLGSALGMGAMLIALMPGIV